MSKAGSFLARFWTATRGASVDFIHDREGAILAWVAIWLPILVGSAALAIDMAYGYWTRNETQVAASAAALAAVAKLVDADENDIADDRVYQAEALEYAFRNMPFARFGAVIHPSCGVDAATGAIDPLASLGECADVKAGYWDQANPSLVPIFVAWDDNDGSDGVVYDPPNMELNAVRVVAKRSQDNGNPLHFFLAGVLGLPQADVQAYAVAKLAVGLNEYLGPDTCLFATSPDEPQSLYVHGNAGVSLVNCDAQVNSNDPCAFQLQGDPTLSMEGTNSYVHVVGPPSSGGYCEVGNSVDIYPDVDDDGDGVADVIGTQEPYIDEPYAGRDPKTGSCINDGPYCGLYVSDFYSSSNPTHHWNFGKSGKYDGVSASNLPDCTASSTSTCKIDVDDDDDDDITVRVFPGIYYGSKESMKLNNHDIEFYPGEYVIYGGELNVGAQTALSVYDPPTGMDGVGFYLTGNTAVIKMAGGGDLDLYAPTSGPLMGYLFFEDPDPAYQPPGTAHSLRGNTNSFYQGTIYLQNDVEFKGTTGTGQSGGGDCFTVIANTIYMNGTNDFQVGDDCAGGGALPEPVPDTTTVLSLVE